MQPQDQWAKFLSLTHPIMSSRTRSEIDLALHAFVNSDATEWTSDFLNSFDRKLVHVRSEDLGLIYENQECEGKRKSLKKVYVKKPEGWKLDLEEAKIRIASNHVERTKITCEIIKLGKSKKAKTNATS